MPPIHAEKGKSFGESLREMGRAGFLRETREKLLTEVRLSFKILPPHRVKLFCVVGKLKFYLIFMGSAYKYTTY